MKTNIKIETKSYEETTKIPVMQELFLLATILSLVFGSALTPKYLTLFFQEPEQTQVDTTQTASLGNTDTNTRPPFEDINITAQSVYVWDINNQRVLYRKNDTEQLPLASVTKLMTAVVAQELLAEEDPIYIEDGALAQEGDSGLLSGEVFQRLTLSDLTLMSSSNDGAYALALAAGSMLSETYPAESFVQAMNIRAKEIGLTETYFRNPTGLDVSETQAGAYGTTRDMAFLMEYIIEKYPDILTYTTENTTRVYDDSGISHDARNTNYYVNSISGLIGSKTGYTDLAGGNLVIAFDAGLNRPVVIAVLGSTRQERFTDVLTLVKETQRLVANE